MSTDGAETDGQGLETGDAAPPDPNANIRVPGQKRRAMHLPVVGNLPAKPVLRMPRVHHPEAVVLFVHGGDVNSNAPTPRRDPAYVRLVPFARDLERRSRGRVGGALVRLSIRGWNDPDLPALDDVRWALEELRKRYPGLPLGIVGHSMGGRVVLHLAEEADVDAIVGLAPWAAEEYDAASFTRTPLLVVHGRRDTVTDPDASRDLVQRARAGGGEATFISMPGGHSMIRRARGWHKITSTFLIKHLLPQAQQRHH